MSTKYPMAGDLLQGDSTVLRGNPDDSLEEAVRAALAKSDKDIARSLAKYPEAVLGAATDRAKRLEWSKADPNAVLVLTEYGIGDPYQYDHVHKAFERAASALRKRPGVEDVYWESINPAVHCFLFKLGHVRRGSGKILPTKFLVIRVNGKADDTYAAPFVGDEGDYAARDRAMAKLLELATPDSGDGFEFGFVFASDAGAARLMTPRGGWIWYGKASELLGGPRSNPPKSPRVGARVVFKPTPASAAMYRTAPPVNAAGTVTTVPLPGRGKSHYLPGPGGGLTYVDWDGFGVQGVSPNDLVLDDPVSRAVRGGGGPGTMSPAAYYNLAASQKRGRENPGTDVLEGMARALWVTSFADWCENLSAAKTRKLREQGLIPGGGGDWCDTAPRTPPSAETAGLELYEAFEELNGPMTDLIALAEEADGATINRENFGHYLAMQALGHGVSWFDDHASFPIKFPRHFEVSTDNGKTLDWFPRRR